MPLLRNLRERWSVRREARRAAPPAVSYRPRRDGRPDPGEVVWAWVPFEEDPAQGKDRPVLLLGKQRGQWVGLMLTRRTTTTTPATRRATAATGWMSASAAGTASGVPAR